MNVGPRDCEKKTTRISPLLKYRTSVHSLVICTFLERFQFSTLSSTPLTSQIHILYFYSTLQLQLLLCHDNRVVTFLYRPIPNSGVEVKASEFGNAQVKHKTPQRCT